MGDSILVKDVSGCHFRYPIQDGNILGTKHLAVLVLISHHHEDMDTHLEKTILQELLSSRGKFLLRKAVESTS